jgi:serine/threonine-protein kinase
LRCESAAQIEVALELLARTHDMPAAAPCLPCLEGRVLGGRYRIERLLGAGAMGRVYLAQHIELGRACAVKVIRPPVHAGGIASASREQSAAVARFRVEAQAASRLDHPNALTVLDFGCEPEEDLWYLVTEHLEGEDLVEVLESGQRLSAGYIAAIVRQVCSALQHAHDHGVVHRDIKPENVRIVPRETDDGRIAAHVKVLDFGTAKILDTANGHGGGARESFVIGTPAYMSPEQASGREVDGRSDVYSLGVLLFEMATGRLPFERTSPIAMAAAHVECRPPAPSSLRDDLDPELESLILWCLRKRPADRPQSAREVRDALDRLDIPSLRAHRAAMTAAGLRSIPPPAPSPVQLEPAKHQLRPVEVASAFFAPSTGTAPTSTLSSVAPVTSAAPPSIATQAPADRALPNAPGPERAVDGLALTKGARRVRVLVVAMAASALVGSGGWLVLSDRRAASVAEADEVPARVYEEPRTEATPPPPPIDRLVPDDSPIPFSAPTPTLEMPTPAAPSALAESLPTSESTAATKVAPSAWPPSIPSVPSTRSVPPLRRASPAPPADPIPPTPSPPAPPAEPALPAGLVDPWRVEPAVPAKPSGEAP